MLKPFNKAELAFDLIQEIGQAGKNSQAFIARDHQLDAEIVIKRMHKASLQHPAEFFAESKALYAAPIPTSCRSIMRARTRTSFTWPSHTIRGAACIS